MTKNDNLLINEIITRGVVDINVKKDLEKKLKSGKKLRVKFGIDPSGFDLTLGHAVPLRKLKQFQDAGHQIVFLIGSFTAQIGDPSGRSQTRKPLTKKQVLDNAKDYLDQAGKILDVSKIEIVYNGDWLEKMSFEDVLRLSSSFTVSQMLQRDMYQERIKSEQEINMVEFLYPLMQGYDSVALKADIEVGGNDQLFNLMAGRVIQKVYGQKPQDIITVSILVGLDGKEKMSKSLGNYIAIFDTPKEMFGKTMSIPDDVILNYFELATQVPLDEIVLIKKQLDSGVNPRDIKVRLAKEIISMYHSSEFADQAENEFNDIFKKGLRPSEIPIKKIKLTLTNPVEIIFTLGLVDSKSDGKRMIMQGGVKLDDKKITQINQDVKLEKGMIFQVGKRKWAEIG